MRLPQRLALLWAMLTLSGCRARPLPPEEPLPPHTVLLSGMLRELSSRPGFAAQLVAQLGGNQGGKRGPALLTPDLLQELRKRIFGKDWQGLDRFPGWTMREINPTVQAADRFFAKRPTPGNLGAKRSSDPAPVMTENRVRQFLDLGPYALDRAETVSLDTPSPLPGFTTAGIVSQVFTDGGGTTVTRGDGPNALAPEHAESQRLAAVLNRLSVNALPGAQPFAVTVGERKADTPDQLVAALRAAGYTVTVHDARYFANFGHLHFQRPGIAPPADVMMPFWVNTQFAVPGTGGLFRRPRPLLVPVSHAELEWEVRGPHMRADVAHYFGVDGKAEWRTMDTLDQAWVLKRFAHSYTGADALEATRLTGLVTLAYMHQHARRPELPFGGYYTLGVCQDPVSAVETKLTGRSTLFPNTADAALFDDPRDAEVNTLFASIPKDRLGARPQPERIFGSLPASPGADGRFAAVSIPGLGEDLAAAYAAWQAGTLQRAHGRLFYALSWTGGVLLGLGLLGGVWWSRRRD